jgi:hypothetical protein
MEGGLICAGTVAGTAGTADALSYLRSIYNDPLQPTSVRMRAAIECLPFEYPKLAAMAIVPWGGDFPRRLEQAVERSRTKVIEHKPRAEISSNGSQRSYERYQPEPPQPPGEQSPPGVDAR